MGKKGVLLIYLLEEERFIVLKGIWTSQVRFSTRQMINRLDTPSVIGAGSLSRKLVVIELWSFQSRR